MQLYLQSITRLLPSTGYHTHGYTCYKIGTTGKQCTIAFSVYHQVLTFRVSEPGYGRGSNVAQ